MIEQMEFLAGAKGEMEQKWPCGICQVTLLCLTHLAGNNYEFSCGGCGNTMRINMVFMKYDYFRYPEDDFPELLTEDDSYLMQKLSAENSISASDIGIQT